MTTTHQKNNRELSANSETEATALSATFKAIDTRNNSEITVTSWKHANIAWLDTDTAAQRSAAQEFIEQNAADIAVVRDYIMFIVIERK